ncbi:DUF6325 family protein [Streptomyces antarcticus]|uniref:DUF6325 family protein n=1 Tax=Streptomyces antarcticus TaxID=2996458 RepID=UPI002271B41F|nr:MULTISPECIES: DUF6325 family protein [unclassified Streptomyces]MCY0945818.1 DUF6325 family protein [Streptomyces sp. H34-AA3]MCZ4084021.1 DUF6325 family protein [Streptomyces sp. H34-S5]
MGQDIEEMGPVDYLVVEFPGNRMTGEAFPLLIDLVDKGLIRILDLRFVRKDTDGAVTALEITGLDDHEGAVELAVFDGASSELLDQDDLDEAGNALQPGNAAAILVYENRWAAPFAAALRRSGAQMVAGGRIPVQALLASIEAEQAGLGSQPQQ